MFVELPPPLPSAFPHITRTLCIQVNVDALHHPEKYAIAREELREVIPSKGPEALDLQLWYVADKKYHPVRGGFGLVVDDAD